jgi:hypothetical protein
MRLLSPGRSGTASSAKKIDECKKEAISSQNPYGNLIISKKNLEDRKSGDESNESQACLEAPSPVVIGVGSLFPCDRALSQLPIQLEKHATYLAPF